MCSRRAGENETKIVREKDLGRRTAELSTGHHYHDHHHHQRKGGLHIYIYICVCTEVTKAGGGVSPNKLRAHPRPDKQAKSRRKEEGAVVVVVG